MYNELCHIVVNPAAGTSGTWGCSARGPKDLWEKGSSTSFSRKMTRIAVLTYRNLLVHREHPEALSGLFGSDRELALELHNRDSSFVYRNYVIEKVLKEEAPPTPCLGFHEQFHLSKFHV